MGRGSNGSTKGRNWRGLVAVLALFVLAFGTALQVGHRPASGATPGVVAGAWMVLCGPDGKALVPSPADGSEAPSAPGNSAPFCPICLALQHAPAVLPVAVATVPDKPAHRETVNYPRFERRPVASAHHSPHSPRGPPGVA